MPRYLEDGFADRDQDREARGGRISQLCMRGWRKSQGKPWMGGAKMGALCRQAKLIGTLAQTSSPELVVLHGSNCRARVSFAEGLERSAAKSILEKGQSHARLPFWFAPI